VIKSFAHGGVKRFFESGAMKGIQQDMAKRLRMRLDALDAVKEPAEMDVPGWDLHELKRDRKETWSVKVTGNYRLTFKLSAGEAREVNLEDYH
jgi:toxin HigB-1